APRDVPHPLLVALLGHATLVLAISLSLKRLLRPVEGSPEAEGRRGRGQQLVVEPLGASALLSSLLAIPAVVEGVGGDLAPLSLWTLWLAGLWLVISWLNRWPALFGAFQAALS